jgi:HAD superfamily hydrolase (TIGR01509 family)
MVRYDLIICDCDGVLVDSELLACQAMLEVLVAGGINASASMIERCVGMKQSDILARIADETGQEIGPGIAEELWPATHALFARELREVSGARMCLQRASIPLCVASSSHEERIRFSLACTGLKDLFGDALFSSHQVARGKPAPDLFLYAAAQMKIAPAACLVIEDSVYGVQAAVAAGMTAIGFTGGCHLDDGHAHALLAAGALSVERDWLSVAPHISIV